MSFKEFHPPHIYSDYTIYFITARTRDKYPYFKTAQQKLLLKEILNSMIKKYGIILYAWVILAFHYHLLIYIKNKNQIIRFIKALHGKSAIELNKSENKPSRRIWVNYWDKCIESEKDFWTHFNYIHHNPIKHGYVTKMEDYEFSSYKGYLLQYGREWLDSTFEQYPVIDFTPYDV